DEHVARHREHFIGIDTIGFVERAQVSFLDNMLLGFGDVDALRIIERHRRIAESDDFHAGLQGERQGRHGTDVSESLHDRSALFRIHLEHVHRALDQVNNAAPSRLTPSFGAADRDRFAGDDFVHAIALVNRIGVHEPRHDLLVRAHVRTHDVGVRADERNHLLHVTARHGLELVPRKFVRIARDAAFRAAIGQIRQRAFPAHPHGERGGFAHRQIRRETRAALGRAECQVMLNAISLESLGAAVIHVDRQRDGHGTLREHQAIAIVRIDLEVIGDDLELVARHLENFVVVDAQAHKAGRKVECPGEKFRWYLSAAGEGVKFNSRFAGPNARNAIMKIETLAVHAGHEVDSATGAVATPIHLSTTFERDAEGNYPHGYIYGRSANPNRNALEKGLAALEGGEEAAAFGSGLAASSAVLQALAAGDHIVAPTDVYHGMTKLLREIYMRWGLEVSFVDMTKPDDVKNAIRSTTKLIWIETPSNPLLKITDIAGVAEMARDAGALCACDNTWAPIV